MITSLELNQIFVFGSNLSGNHTAGAAKQAKEQFGAEQGIGEGLTGKCYAFPTLDYGMKQRETLYLFQSRDKLYATARALPEKTFLLTKVGCGIAQYEEQYMKFLFENAPENIIKPKEWQ